MAQRLSLAQQIAQLNTPAPPEFNAEEFLTAEREDEDDDIQGIDGARDHYLDVGTSALRKLQDSVEDLKYEGVRTSRKRLQEQDFFSEEGGKDECLEEEEEEERGVEDDEHENEPEPASSEDEVDEEDEDSLPEEKMATPTKHDHEKKATNETEGVTSTLRKTREDDRKKGLAISKQIEIWDGLLDARIRFQKASVAANRLPVHQWSTFRESSHFQESLLRMLQEAITLSEELFDLQEASVSREAVSLPPRKRRRTEASGSISDYKTQLEDASDSLSAFEHAHHPPLVQTLNKWSSKIQAIAPSVLLPANRNAFSKDRNQIKSAVQLMDENLLDYTKLLGRTHVWRGRGTRLGVPTATENDEDLFDDTDFYQQLLRDVIDARDAFGANDWMLAQKERKARKKVDTKASKGRKLRYEVHERLRNFMVPITVRGAWHEEQIDELFSSLLGKGFENALKDYTSGDAMQRDSDELQGFRLFG
ncbi:hypothetical protein E1B28_007429 [Marasmius oreades]|uniref:Protein BFR2 n=1 Tax=Marasmius oreades TaxID=181124 RepID=A0A9P7UTG1_9AGAR|nr:uncharacterized protein E1B28_007429 [Marasmius oreades]KAG7093782.1 hypothetical protein E1B28_007429 [Marasmius oreades]